MANKKLKLDKATGLWLVSSPALKKIRKHNKLIQDKADQVLKKIEKLGGHVVWEREFFWVVLSGTTVTDADLTLFQSLPLVEHLILDDTKITDAGLAHLKALSKLELLSIANTKVSKKAVAALVKQRPGLTINTKKGKRKGINPFTGEPFAD